MTDEVTNDAETAAEMSTATFLQGIAPGEKRQLVAADFEFPEHGTPTFKWPPLELYCSSPTCLGFRFADPRAAEVELRGYNRELSLWCAYTCRNCTTFLKLYAIVLTAPSGRQRPGSVLKVGEYPLFGPHLPPGVVELLGEDAEYFLKGHRSESQGLGIAAFSYYRRVVENQRTHIFDEIISAAEHVGADPAMIERLTHLRQHWRFQQSVDELTGCLPQILLIEGQNPLELLHPVLSDSIHDRSDEEALEIRLVLINLAERIALAKTQSDELKQAVAKLSARKAARKTPPPAAIKGGKT